MNRTLFAGLIALPFAASANPILTPISDTKTVVDVEAWGTIYRVAPGSEWTSGTKVHHTLRIDTSFAPADRDAALGRAEYAWNDPCIVDCPPLQVPAPSGFVSIPGSTLRGTSRDLVVIADDYYVFDYDEFLAQSFEERTTSTGIESIYSRFTVYGPIEFTNGTGLVQEFDLGPEELGPTANVGEFAVIKNGVRDFFEFAIERLRVTPRVCRL